MLRVDQEDWDRRGRAYIMPHSRCHQRSVHRGSHGGRELSAYIYIYIGRDRATRPPRALQRERESWKGSDADQAGKVTVIKGAMLRRRPERHGFPRGRGQIPSRASDQCRCIRPAVGNRLLIDGTTSTPACSRGKQQARRGFMSLTGYHVCRDAVTAGRARHRRSRFPGSMDPRFRCRSTAMALSLFPCSRQTGTNFPRYMVQGQR